MQLLFGKIVAFSISGIARLGVADHISDDPRPVEEMAAASATHAPSLYRVLRMLASVGVFVEHPERKFAIRRRTSSPHFGASVASRRAEDARERSAHAQSYQHIAGFDSHGP